jgi:predicted DCC family thiol-disulfide oxidoreductase YuxK
MNKQKFNISDVNINVVFFDGYCGLCNKLVDFLLKRDRKKRLYFASQQSDFAKKIISENLILSDVDAVIYLESGKIHIKSSAIIKIISQLKGVWKLGMILFVVPAFLRNLIYDWIAKKRYLWFGKNDTCYVPQPEFKSRFLDDSEKQ